MEVLKEHIKALYRMLSKETGQTPEVFHLDNFRYIDGKLYYKGKSTSLTIRGGKLRSGGEIENNMLGKERLYDLVFDIPLKGKLMVRQAIMLNKVEEGLPSVSDVAEADVLELQEMTENTARSTNNLIKQFEGTLPMRQLQGLDKQLRSIGGSLKVEVAEKVQLENLSSKKSVSSQKSETIQNTTMVGHYEGRGLCIRLYRYASQLVRSLLPD